MNRSLVLLLVFFFGVSCVGLGFVTHISWRHTINCNWRAHVKLRQNKSGISESEADKYRIEISFFSGKRRSPAWQTVEPVHWHMSSLLYLNKCFSLSVFVVAIAENDQKGREYEFGSTLSHENLTRT